ncbi:putative DNA polymerase epsilon subunit B [Trypanosoma cruzi]|uniref:DNA polymerase II subunit 2 n=1 Tax=Trypanosoma cruzi TaxID=5693 RepID=A0A2V2UWH5_TRYCR|nr:putative DNA polymerase epsilon subunit B [Trypanosoma cruzi]
MAAAHLREKNSLQAVIIVMSHVHLDQTSTVNKLVCFFKEMQNRTESELMNTTLVMVGDFSSLTIHYDDISHLPDPFEGSNRYKLLMDTLAMVITTHAPSVAQHTQVVLVPGSNDLTGLLGVLPQPPIVSVFTRTLQARLKKVFFAPNPCRLRFFTHEIVVTRRDFFRSLQGSGRAFNRSVVETPNSISSFESVAKTILDEAHLAPEVKEGILWKADGALFCWHFHTCSSYVIAQNNGSAHTRGLVLLIRGRFLSLQPSCGIHLLMANVASVALTINPHRSFIYII